MRKGNEGIVLECTDHIGWVITIADNGLCEGWSTGALCWGSNPPTAVVPDGTICSSGWLGPNVAESLQQASGKAAFAVWELLNCSNRSKVADQLPLPNLGSSEH